MSRIVDVVAAVIWRDGRYLAATRPSGKVLAGHWEFPGGKVEDGEAASRALARELDEELGIRVSEAIPWQVVEHRYPEAVVRLRLFHVTAFSGEVRPREGQEVRWVTPDEALGLPFLPADLPLVRELAGV